MMMKLFYVFVSAVFLMQRAVVVAQPGVKYWTIMMHQSRSVICEQSCAAPNRFAPSHFCAGAPAQLGRTPFMYHATKSAYS